MTLLKNGAIVSDAWMRVADDAPVPPGADVILSLSRLNADGLPHGRSGRLGVALGNTDPVSALLPWLDRVELIALDFPKFTDGRAYTQARVLREQCGYTGELRATGQVLIDQLLIMRRCGFDAFEIGGTQNLAAWLKALEAFSVVYQPTGDGRTPAWRLRRHLVEAAHPTSRASARDATSPSCTVAIETQRGSTVSSSPRHAQPQSDATSCALPSAASPRSTPCEPSLSPPSI